MDCQAGQYLTLDSLPLALAVLATNLWVSHSLASLLQGSCLAGSVGHLAHVIGELLIWCAMEDMFVGLSPFGPR